MPFTDDPSDRDLVRGVLTATRRLTLEQAGEEIGVSRETIARWRRGPWSRLSTEVRENLIQYLQGWERHGPLDYIPGDRGVLGWLREPDLLDEILHSLGDPAAKGRRTRAIVNTYKDLVCLFGPMPLWLKELTDTFERDG